jgi:hypothetical protein
LGGGSWIASGPASAGPISGEVGAAGAAGAGAPGAGGAPAEGGAAGAGGGGAGAWATLSSARPDAAANPKIVQPTAAPVMILFLILRIAASPSKDGLPEDRAGSLA